MSDEIERADIRDVIAWHDGRAPLPSPGAFATYFNALLRAAHTIDPREICEALEQPERDWPDGTGL